MGKSIGWIMAGLFAMSVASMAAAGTSSSPLPKQGSIAWNVGIGAWLGSFQDIKDFYGAGLTTTSTPYGAEIDLGADYTIAPSFQVGLQAQGMMRLPETVSFGGLLDQKWNVNAIGGALVLKYLIPVQDKWNVIIHGEGGYYTLVGAGVQASGIYTDTMNMNASNVGGMLAVEGEFLQGGNNSWAVDLGLGYRYLQMKPITVSGTFMDIPLSGTLPNLGAAGDAMLDLSGFRVNATLRFY